MAIHGPYHASHLHNEADVKKILASSDPQIGLLLDQYKIRFPVQSTSTGSWFDMNMSAAKLLVAVVTDILIEPLRMGQVLDRCVETGVFLKSEKCRIISCGPTALRDRFVAVMKSKTDAEVVLHEDDGELSPALISSGRNPTSPKKRKLAIVGMAGRFPNAADHEKFWDLLEAGLDVHRKVIFIPSEINILLHANQAIGPQRSL